MMHLWLHPAQSSPTLLSLKRACSLHLQPRMRDLRSGSMTRTHTSLHLGQCIFQASCILRRSFLTRVAAGELQATSEREARGHLVTLRLLYPTLYLPCA